MIAAMAKAVKEKPILFSSSMVKAILEGRKTQTRRIAPVLLPGVHKDYIWSFEDEADWAAKRAKQCRYGQPGDRLWVRETHYRYTGCAPAPSDWIASPDGDPYKAICYDDDRESLKGMRQAAGALKVPSIFMPRWGARLTLEIRDVRVERLRDITEEDAKAEGVAPSICPPYEHMSYRSGFCTLWDEINGKGAPWESNPWVWAINFKRVEANQ